MLLSSQAVIDLLPQKPPMVMIDSLLLAEEARCRSGFSINAGHLFVNENIFREAGLIENIAQTAAIQASYLAQQAGRTPPGGFIAGIKRLEISALPMVGERIETEIEIVNKVLDIRVLEAKVFLDGREIASCEMKILVTERE